MIDTSWLYPQEGDLYRIEFFISDDVGYFKFEELDENGEVISTFEESLDSLIKMRVISLREPDMFLAILNIRLSCPDLMFRLLEGSISLINKKEEKDIHFTQEENVGIKN